MEAKKYEKAFRKKIQKNNTCFSKLYIYSKKTFDVTLDKNVPINTKWEELTKKLGLNNKDFWDVRYIESSFIHANEKENVHKEFKGFEEYAFDPNYDGWHKVQFGEGAPIYDTEVISDYLFTNKRPIITTLNNEYITYISEDKEKALKIDKQNNPAKAFYFAPKQQVIVRNVPITENNIDRIIEDNIIEGYDIVEYKKVPKKLRYILVPLY